MKPKVIAVSFKPLSIGLCLQTWHSLSSWVNVGAVALMLFGSTGRSETFSSTGADGFARFETSFGNDVSVRAGGSLTVSASMGTYGGTKIDYGTGFGDIDAFVSGPWWLNSGQSNLQGNFGPENATLQWLYRGNRFTYFHVTFSPSYAEANPGYLRVNVRGCWVTFTALPAAIAQGDAFTAVVQAQDDNGLLSGVSLQISTNGGAWTTFTTAGAGNGASSTTPATTMTAGTAGTTYQFRTWAIDTNGYQSRIVMSGVYATQAPPPITNYLANGVDLGNLFQPLNGGPKAAPTGLTCVIGGTTYDLSDLFRQRATAARSDVGFNNASATDLSQIFEKK